MPVTPTTAFWMQTRSQSASTPRRSPRKPKSKASDSTSARSALQSSPTPFQAKVRRTTYVRPDTPRKNKKRITTSRQTNNELSMGHSDSPKGRSEILDFVYLGRKSSPQAGPFVLQLGDTEMHSNVPEHRDEYQISLEEGAPFQEMDASGDTQSASKALLPPTETCEPSRQPLPLLGPEGTVIVDQDQLRRDYEDQNLAREDTEIVDHDMLRRDYEAHLLTFYATVA